MIIPFIDFVLCQLKTKLKPAEQRPTRKSNLQTVAALVRRSISSRIVWIVLHVQREVEAVCRTARSGRSMHLISNANVCLR